MKSTTLPTKPENRMLSPLATLRDEMDRLFDAWIGGEDLAPLRMLEGGDRFLPRIDVTERETELELTAELPGVAPADIELELCADALVLRGKKRLEKEEHRKDFLRSERHYGSFYRQIPLPWPVDVAKAKVDAGFVHGVLRVHLQKPDKVAPTLRKIPIQV
jgi:HSP20 family protein